jgi:hypothetical protein
MCESIFLFSDAAISYDSFKATNYSSGYGTMTHTYTYEELEKYGLIAYIAGDFTPADLTHTYPQERLTDLVSDDDPINVWSPGLGVGPSVSVVETTIHPTGLASVMFTTDSIPFRFTIDAWTVIPQFTVDAWLERTVVFEGDGTGVDGRWSSRVTGPGSMDRVPRSMRGSSSSMRYSMRYSRGP